MNTIWFLRAVAIAAALATPLASIAALIRHRLRPPSVKYITKERKSTVSSFSIVKRGLKARQYCYYCMVFRLHRKFPRFDSIASG